MAIQNHGLPRLRRPLKSKTYQTFLRVLSLSRHPSFAFPLQDDNTSRKAEELCSAQSNKTVCDDKKEGGCVLDVRSSIDLVECRNDKKENPGFDEIVDILADEGNGVDPVSEGMGKGSGADCVLEVRSLSFSPGRELIGNADFSVEDVFEAINCSLNVDAADELLKHGESGAKEVVVEEQNMSVEIEQELQRKEMELEKLIMGSDVDVSHLAGVCEELEDGELSRDMGADDMLVDVLSKDDILPAAEKANELEAFKYSSVGGEVARDVGQTETKKNKGHTSSFLDAMTSKNDIMEVDGKCSGEMNGSCLLEISGAKERSGEMNLPGHLAVASDCVAPADNIKSGSIAEKRSSTAAEKVDDAPKKKRGPLTKERRAKKKKKDKIRQAEKDRMNGVKRLKFEPIVKPKVVAYCRHYLKGRCQEGEKCKFSHDTVPITKSTPCCHFARHSCMKGDDCPFDHQLSKYPCNNIATKGFCSRGVDCLFSHEMPAKEARLTVSYASVCETEKPEHTTTTTTQKGVNIFVHGNMPAVPKFKQPDSQISKTDYSNNKVQPVAQNNRKLNEVVDMAASRTPRGINFLSFGKSRSDGKVVSKLDFRTGKSPLFTPSPNKDGPFISSDKSQTPMPRKATPSPFTLKSAAESEVGIASSSKNPFLLEASPLAHKALQSTLAFAANVEPRMKLDSSKT